MYRITAMVLTQLPVLLFFGGQHDLLFGFNQTSAGLHTLVILFFAVPLTDLAWVITEFRGLARPPGGQDRTGSALWIFVALAFLAEALVIDLHILSTAGM